ncbi:MAG: class I SAM-dependent methyltransferase [Actinomycetota bacterium]
MTDRPQTPDRIRDFYDRHPYPPPVADLTRYREGWQDERQRRAEYHLLWPYEPYREDITVLIAGCGTSQAAKHAIRRPGGSVVGIDVAPAGIAHNAELKAQHGLDNLELHEIPIEAVAELGMTFDLIVCTGVLHHLADPQVGLEALRSVLKPGGALHLMVYATYGRTGVYMLQEYARRLDVQPTDGEIGSLLETLGAIPRDHPIGHLLGAPDFRKGDAVADALLNPRDRSYTVPELLDLLDASDFAIGRWYRQAPYLPECGAIASTPHAKRLGTLPRQDQFAAVELLRGTMARHSLVAYPDRTRTPQIPFDGTRWLGYVPIRRTSTLVVRDPERLPAGAAAVLLNREHTYADLVLPIDYVALQMIERIDGRRTIGEIASDVGSEMNDARTFFRQLWLYDQIVVDASGTAG